MSDLEITRLSKGFGSQQVLNGLDMTVAAGSFTSVLGPSGSGKTTLLRVIVGFERADTGTVRIGGEVVEDGEHHVEPAHRHVGYVPQDGSLFPHLDVEMNVGFGLPRKERRGRRVRELLAMVGLEGLGRRYPHQLSGGQQQRVALARALAVRPSLVLLDEPFSSLDATLRASVRQDVRHVLFEAGTTAVLVTHDQDEALSLSDKVAVLQEGRICQYDSPAGLYDRPASPELAQALGQANLLPGTAHEDTAETVLGPVPLAGASFTGRAPVLVLVRPEQLEIVPEREPGAPVRIVHVEYYGHDALVQASPVGSDGPVLLVRVTAPSPLPAVGSEVTLVVRGDAVAWPAQPSDPHR